MWEKQRHKSANHRELKKAIYMSFNTALLYYKNKKGLRGLFNHSLSVFDVCCQWNLPAAEAAAPATTTTAATAAAEAAEAVTPCQGLVGCY
jgi:hypothetical protein